MIPHCQTLIDMGWLQPKSRGPNLKALSKQTIPKLLELPLILFLRAEAKWWIRTSGGSIAKPLKTSFATNGMLEPRTELATTPNTTQTPSMKPTAALMQAYGIGWALDTHLLVRQLALGFSSHRFSHFFLFAIFSLFCAIIIPHLRCCRKGV